jgi:hypothetical protein
MYRCELVEGSMLFWLFSERSAGLLCLRKEHLLPFSFFFYFSTRYHTTAILTPYVIVVNASVVAISPFHSQQASGFTKPAGDPSSLAKGNRD